MIFMKSRVKHKIFHDEGISYTKTAIVLADSRMGDFMMCKKELLLRGRENCGKGFLPWPREEFRRRWYIGHPVFN